MNTAIETVSESKVVKAKNNPVSGFNYFLRGFSLIMKKGIRKYVIIPLLINIVVFSVAIYYGVSQFSVWMEQLTSYLPDWLDWLTWLIWPVFSLSILVVLFYTFNIIGNLIAGSFNSTLSEAVERHMTGRPMETKGGIAFIIKDILVGIISELGKLLYFILWALPILLLFIIPVVNIAAPFIWLAFSAWMMTIGYADYPMANHFLAWKPQHKVLKQKRMLSLGFGGGATLALMIPVVNFVVMPVAVAGATAMWVEQLSDTQAAKEHLTKT